MSRSSAKHCYVVYGKVVTSFAFLIDVARNNIGREWEWSSIHESDKLVVCVDAQHFTPHVESMHIVKPTQ